ncbi:transcriptional regulator [Vibrio sp. qd031]|uniref:SgrR family transcriptional regulator n=1 Tax=Vibrio sp. qd031 TaxID=1603038 RepID=UPI000A10F90E|nr:SgrR family transcriptional regulator [Vibrio sp. qd031]ORT50966.1 transcriptional regulator [Vibrio sp. qd031]
MSSPRLRQQFDLLYRHFSGQDSDVQIEEITEILSCTRRNARIVLSKLHELGWIQWSPSSGRGKLSSLIFNQSQDDVNIEMAKRLLEEGKIGRALAVLDQDVHKLTQVVQDYIGLQNRKGESIVRLPYYRPLQLVSPLYRLRRSEKNIIQQVASGLTTLDENERLTADIAHHWQMLTPVHWRFFIRPNIRCHNGNLLTLEQIIHHLDDLADAPLFCHITKVTQSADLCIDVYLTRPDVRFDLLLSDVSAKVITQWVTQEDGQHYPQATGPFRVVHNDDSKLKLVAFDDYFGFRPLIDQVEVVVIDDIYSNLVYPSLSQSVLPNSSEPKQEQVDLDPGCTFLLLDKQQGLAKTADWADYFSSRLNSLALFSHLPQQKIVDLGLIHAFGLKPGWQHTSGYSTKSLAAPTQQNIVVAYQHEHTVFADIAHAIKNLLEQDLLEVELVTFDSVKELAKKPDIWVMAMGIATHREDALAAWYLCEPRFNDTVEESVHKKVVSLIEHWQSGSDLPFPGLQISQQLVGSKQILPMFHCWLGVNQDHSGTLQNAKTNALGWFDFSRVWLKPGQ